MKISNSVDEWDQKKNRKKNKAFLSIIFPAAKRSAAVWCAALSLSFNALLFECRSSAYYADLSALVHSAEKLGNFPAIFIIVDFVM